MFSVKASRNFSKVYLVTSKHFYWQASKAAKRVIRVLIALSSATVVQSSCKQQNMSNAGIATIRQLIVGGVSALLTKIDQNSTVEIRSQHFDVIIFVSFKYIVSDMCGSNFQVDWTIGLCEDVNYS